MIFLRMGARLLFLRTDKIQELKDFIVHNLEGRLGGFEQCLDESTEDSTIVFITNNRPKKTDMDDAKYIILVHQPSSILLASILSSDLSGLIYRADLGPAILIMRIAGNEDKIVGSLKKSYGGELVSWKDGIRIGEKMDTLLTLTNKPIGRKVSGRDFSDNILLLSHPVNYVQQRLRSESIVFITQSMDTGEWFELRINIYDSKRYYSEHYRRLMLVLNRLEIGMVLGETWTRDHALVLYSVLAYQVRLFTVYPPYEVKKILLGLEYNEEGERLVDLDLYYRNKKVSWVSIDKKRKNRKKRDKVEECKQYRKELFEKLPDTTIQKLLEIEEKISKDQ